VRCSTCDAPAVIDQPYRGAHLCESHFRESVEERVRREMHRQLPRFGHGTVAVALSGGKDSGVALALAHRYFHRRPTVRVVALSIDEGIAGYRAATLKAARALTDSLGVEHRIVSAQESIGTTIDRTASDLPGTVPCSFCGVWRRQLLNRAARDVGAGALVLGFNLDDLSQTVLMNLVRGDLDRLVPEHLQRNTQSASEARIVVNHQNVHSRRFQANFATEYLVFCTIHRALCNAIENIPWGPIVVTHYTHGACVF